RSFATSEPSGRTVSDVTVLARPVPKADQVLPFHLAQRLTTTPPAEVKSPPITRSPLGRIEAARTGPLQPEPSGNQVLPSHAAMLLAGAPPADVKLPTTTSLPSGVRAMARTSVVARGPPMPLPSADHAEPSQLAMLLAVVPPACVKRPPTTSSLPKAGGDNA